MRRRGLPHLGVLGAREHGDRPVLGRHRDPVVGLGQHGGLAGDRVAQHGEAVGGADRERVEAVEVAQAALERRLERRRPRAAATSGSRPRPRCRCRSGTRCPRARSSRRSAVVVRQRAVVHEAEVEAGRERVRAPAVVTRLSVAIRVCPSAWRAAHVLEARSARTNVARVARLLVDLDPLAGAHDPQVGPVRAQPRLRARRRRRRPRSPRGVARTSGPTSPPNASPSSPRPPPSPRRVRREQRHLARARRRRVAVDRDARRVRPAVAHLDEHRAEVRAEALGDRRRLREQARRCRTWNRS